ncbi:FAD:protein FMN transferase [Cupriavidus sp. CuC1]|uniref:FAD:protein FMN transferase n=1 Tax=Cupriavidus sp. CuC1 TaxID=3373131 RepID=UPI0037CE3ADD
MSHAAACACRRARPLLGTLVDIQARGADAAQAVRAAFARIAQVQRLMSCHDRFSDIGRFNAAGVDQPVEMDARTLAVLTVAARLQAESDGAFDCERGTPRPRAAGGRAWVIEGTKVRKHRPLQLDLGGIAKGYAVDCAVEALGGFDLDYALVNAGGDMRHAGTAPATVALREPGAPACTAMVWRLDNAALASSSVGGLWPEPGSPARIDSPHLPNALAAGAGVSVLAPSCLFADALTKVVLACRAPEHPLLARYGARTLLYRDGHSGG